MDALHDIHLIGLSHRTAPVAIRERYAVQPADAASCLGELCSGDDMSEVVLLSTCNRTEALIVVGDGSDPEPLVRRRLFRNLGDEHVYTYSGVQAVIHLFRVAAGLDSLVLGESEILAQLKTAIDSARGAGTLGTILLPLTTHAISVGKRVRSETPVGTGTLSVAKVAVDLAHHAFGKLENNRALVVGAGDTGMLVARHLRESRIATIDFANRTVERAEAAANEFGGAAFGLDELSSAIGNADIVVVCVDGGKTVVGTEDFRRRKRRDQPQLVIDLSIPRGVAEGVSELDEVLHYDLDDLEPVVERNRKSRIDASTASAEILVAEVHKFLSLRTYASFSPAITELRRRFDEIREKVLDGVTAGNASPRELELAHELSKQLLDLSLHKMKDSARRSKSEAALDREYQRFLENL